MASSKCKGFVWKRKPLDIVISSLRKENACLKKALLELSRQHSEHLKLVERFISLHTVRLEHSQQQIDEDNETALPSMLHKKGHLKIERISAYVREMEEIKDKLVSLSTRCQYLQKKVQVKKDSESDERDSSFILAEFERHLRVALEKNKQWLEYDQQREAHVRAIMARMLWLEKQLSEANQARSQQHNEDHSHEKKKIDQMQEYYERLLQKVKDEVEVLREQLNITNQNLTTTQKWCREREMEVEELKQQLQSERLSSQQISLEDDHCSEDEAKRLSDKTKDLEYRLHKERRRSATFELQMNLLQKYMLNCHHGDQEKIADLEKKLSSLKPTSTNRNVLNDSFLSCPGCQAQYPASHHRDLLNHMEICLD